METRQGGKLEAGNTLDAPAKSQEGRLDFGSRRKIGRNLDFIEAGTEDLLIAQMWVLEKEK